MYISTEVDWWSRASAVFNGLLVVVGAVGSVLALRTLRVIEKQTRYVGDQVGVSRDTAERQLRAYVQVESALLKFKKPGVPEVQVHFKNFGQTPAFDVRSWIHMWVERYPLQVTLPEPPSGFQMSANLLPPGASPHTHVIEKVPPVSPEHVRLLGTPEGTVYTYGEIRYKDIFDKERITKFRFLYGPRVRTQTVDGVVTAMLTADVEGNEAT